MTSLPAPLRRLLDLSAGFTGVLNALQPVAALAARLYVAQVFFLSGLTKLRERAETAGRRGAGFALFLWQAGHER